jgi:hypothetical protein
MLDVFQVFLVEEAPLVEKADEQMEGKALVTCLPAEDLVGQGGIFWCLRGEELPEEEKVLIAMGAVGMG